MDISTIIAIILSVLTVVAIVREIINEQKQKIIDKACEWLCEHIDDYARVGEDGAWVEHSVVRDFKKAIEE